MYADTRFDKALQYLDQHGWCQFSFEDGQGRVCAMGAIRKVMHRAEWEAAAKRLADHLRINSLSIADWNNTKGRTKEQVQAALRAAAGAVA
jgi:hypothetical protein